MYPESDGIQIFNVYLQDQTCKLVYSCTFEKGLDMDVVDNIRIRRKRVVVRYGEKFVLLDWEKGWLIKSKAVSVSRLMYDCISHITSERYLGSRQCF